MFIKNLIIILSLLCFVSLEELSEVEKSRILKKELSDEKHFIGEDHNPEYDHEAFLGEEEAAVFDELTPAESIERLSNIVIKIDQDVDGFVTHTELKEWIEQNRIKYIVQDVTQQWNVRNPANKEKLTWEEYNSTVYGFLNDLSPEEREVVSEGGLSYAQMLKRDERRWSAADADEDSALTKEEFTHFLHPQEVGHMTDVVVMETVEDVDLDGDGKISIEEYVADIYKGEVGEDEPDWVDDERHHFISERDKNEDGFMDFDEVRAWVLPPESDVDQATAEATHLIGEADADEDGRLTEDEILDKYDVFVGSQVTDFGEALRAHEEL